MFENLLIALKAEQYTVSEFEYCGQGEPLTHGDFRRFVRLARQYYPTATQRLITSGNFDYQETIGEDAIDQIYVSCDGLYQHSYEKYRRGGNVAKALKFMADIPKVLNNIRQHIIWKYILFEFNDFGLRDR